MCWAITGFSRQHSVLGSSDTDPVLCYFHEKKTCILNEFSEKLQTAFDPSHPPWPRPLYPWQISGMVVKFSHRVNFWFCRASGNVLRKEWSMLHSGQTHPPKMYIFSQEKNVLWGQTPPHPGEFFLAVDKLKISEEEGTALSYVTKKRAHLCCTSVAKTKAATHLWGHPRPLTRQH